MSDKLNAPTVITAHSNADFDCLAAMVAARKLYPGAILLFPGSQEKNLRNFFIQSAMYMFNFKSAKEIDLGSVKTLVVVDTRQKHRLDHVKGVFENRNLTVHAFDHHPDSDEDLEYAYGIVENWGSTATILAHELQAKGVELSSDEATIIGLGIYEDTGSFTFNSTTSHDFTAAAWLLSQGMDVITVSDLITRDLNAEQIAILNSLLESAQTHEIRGVPVVVAEVSTEDYVGDFALLAHKLLDMENIRVLFALGRMHDRVHLVARSRSPEVDVGQICASFGGGGHAYAASASIKDRTLAQVKDELFALLYSHIDPQNRAKDVMSSPAVVIERDKSIDQAVEIMTRFGLKALPVIDPSDGETFVGILEHEIADKAVAHGLGDMSAAEYMARDVTAVEPDTDLYDIIEIVLGRKQNMVPVMEKGKIGGVVTKTDLINILVEEPARIPESLLPEKRRERNIRVMIRERLPDDMVSLLVTAGEMAEQMDYAVYAVGGFVRDILLSVPNLDLDLVVEGDGIAFASALAEKLGGRIRSHGKFKTAVVILENGQRVDVATARLEYYEHPAALPTVELSSIKMDLYRRDFTINALAVHLNPQHFGRLVDFFGAQRDIKERIVRVLHSLSFIEDPTRILRAIRFEQRYGLSIGGQTERLIKNAVGLNMIHKLSASRLFNELRAIMEEKKAPQCLKRLRDYKILRAVHQSLKLTPSGESLLEEVEKVLTWYKLLYLSPKPANWMLYFLVLLEGVDAEEAESVLRRLVISRRVRDEFLNLRDRVRETHYRLKKWLSGPMRSNSDLYFIMEPLQVEGALYLMARSSNEEIRKALSTYLTRLRDLELDIGGDDLKQMGLTPGPAYTEVLRGIKAAMLDGVAEDREEQLALADELVSEKRDGLSDDAY
jgi:tRNA nucleotidyltransferase (CCA-adding enzyme)